MEPTTEDIPTRRTKNEMIKSEQAKKLAESREFMPIVSPKQTVEVPVQPKPQVEQIEKVGEKLKKTGKPEAGRKKVGGRKKKEGHSQLAPKIPKQPGKSEKLEGNAVLIITEKPQAAAKISAALSGGRAKQISAGAGVYFYEFRKGEENIIVACAVGHLFSLSQDVKGSGYPIFEVSWKPNSEVKKKDFTKKYYANLSRLVKRAKEIIIATDYDVEGEVIGYNVVRFIAGQKDAKRMKFSSLTASEIEDSFNNVSPTISWGQALAGETRHYLDWFYGINLSRALMASIKSAGKFRIMSIGRVQGPALNLIVQKERQIEKFKPEPFWRVFLDLIDSKDKSNRVEVKYIKDITDKKELRKFEGLKGKEARVETSKSAQKIPPLPPFDLTALQTESYRFFLLNPAKTLQIAQQLYLAGLISYPRTNSQKIPEAINPKAIFKRLAENFSAYVSAAIRSRPVEGHKSDPAHPSIYPTGEFQELSGDEKKVYELIVRRFVSCFCGDAEVENKVLTAEVNSLVFKARGLRIKESGWMAVYGARLDEKEMEDMNGKALIDKVKINEDQTKPPRRYSPASIITELEKRKLGTKATRANIIETLYSRNYITDEKSIKATSLGINLIKTLEKYSPIIIDEKLTREMEKETEQMQGMKHSEELGKKQDVVLDKAKKMIGRISSDFHKNEVRIGKELVSASEALWKQQAVENEICICPVCQKGKLTIKFSPKNKKRFIACNAYPECKTTFSLPPYGFVKKLSEEKKCERCGFPILMSVQKGKRPWFFCFNPQCPGRLERQKENAAQEETSERSAEEPQSEPQ